VVVIIIMLMLNIWMREATCLRAESKANCSTAFLCTRFERPKSAKIKRMIVAKEAKARETGG
jgi:hypothetical protein